MKLLGRIELDGTAYPLVQAEWSGQLAPPTSASILAPMTRLDADQIVGSVLRLHIGAPEWAPLRLDDVPAVFHAPEAADLIVTLAARIWREHYDPKDFTDEYEPVAEEPDQSGRSCRRLAGLREFGRDLLPSLGYAVFMLGIYMVAAWLADGRTLPTLIVFALLLFSGGAGAALAALVLMVIRSLIRAADGEPADKERAP